MKKNRINVIAYLLALVFFVGIFSGSQVLAAANKLVMDLPAWEDLHETIVKSDGQLTFKYWDISKDYSYSENPDARVSVANKLYGLSDEDLNAMYPSHEVKATYQDKKLTLAGLEDGYLYFRNSISSSTTKYISSFTMQVPLEGASTIKLVDKIKCQPLKSGAIKLTKVDQYDNRLEGVGFELYKVTDGKDEKVPLIGEYVYSEKGSTDKLLYTDKNGEINVSNLPYGTYYFKEVKPLAGYIVEKDTQDFKIESSNTISVKVVNEKTQYGGFKFLKIANDKDKSPLEGATFKVTQKIGDSYETVIQEGKELILTSGKDGRFEVNNLAYGDYYLWEVKAPQGYKKLESSVKFTVSEEMNKKVLIIKNDKEPKIPMPKTGELMIPFLLVSSVAMYGTGYKLSRDEKDKENKEDQ